MLHLKEILSWKTTLATKIAEDFNAKTVERFADNPFLPKFYKDQNRYAFPLEMSFLATGISNYPMIWRNLICLRIFWLQIIISLNP
jgi:deoxyadenosine/deoxycytidine kinase